MEPDQERLEEIIDQLGAKQGLDAVERRLASVAPKLQKLLDDALHAGGWFDEAHEGLVLKTATHPDEDGRIEQLRSFVIDQTRLGMLVGVAVGWEIAERLATDEELPVDPEVEKEA